MRIIIEPTKERVRRTGACEPAHIQPRPDPEVILFGADRERRHISGYRMRRRRSPKPAPAVLFQGFGNDNDDDDEGLLVEPVSKPPAIPVLKVRPEGLATSDLVDAGVVLGATGAKRGRVREYTQAARRRLREAVLSIGHELLPRKRGRRKGTGRPCFFWRASLITLTYREGHVPPIDTCYAHLAAFWKQLKRVPGWENACGVQVREYQENGSLHFHLLVHWGVNRWTRPFSEVQAWLSETWAGIVAKDQGPDEYHLRAGTNICPVLTDKMLEVYVSQGGVQKLQPGAGMAGELSKRLQKSSDVLLAMVDSEPDAAEQARRLDALLSEAEGHEWWGYLDGPRFKALARVTRAEVSPEVARKLERATRGDWLAFFEKKGVKVKRWEIPQYAMGVVSDRIIAEVGVRQALMEAVWVDENTGEVHEVPTAPALIVVAVGGGSVQVAPAVSAAQPEPQEVVIGGMAMLFWPDAGGPPSGPRVIPAMWLSRGSPPLSRGGLGVVKPPGAGPPVFGPTGLPTCTDCGDPQLKLDQGLCIHCDGTLPRGVPPVRPVGGGTPNPFGCE